MLVKWILPFVLFSTSLALAPVSERIVTNPDDYGGFRLPSYQVPLKYIVDLTVGKDIFNGNSTTFNGQVAITFQVTQLTNIIQIHSKVNIIGTPVIISPESLSLAVSTWSPNTTTDILTITMAANLNTNTNYTLSINYNGDLDTKNMRGFYRSNYVDSLGVTKYLVTTQFQPTHARAAFPCFDEPTYKSTFVIAITYPTGHNALGNTLPNGNPVAIDAENERITFHETPVMSVYLIAFIISDFNCTTGDPIELGIPHSVCSRVDSAEDRGLAVEYGPQLMQALENITGIKYSTMNLGKMDQVALPDFSAGAMENWGLVTYRERALLWNTVESSNSYKQSIVAVIAHEFAHMWFGNLVTCQWWDYTFLNEGFARYFQYFGVAQITELEVTESWEMTKQFVVDQVQSIFQSDAVNTSIALTSKASTPAEISGKFSSISYNKGATIIRMIENFIGSANFLSGIRSYLTTKASSTASPSDLWNALQSFTPNETLPSNVTLAEVVDNWVNRGGFPVISATANGNNVVLSQKRFLNSGTDNTQWYVPISYTVSGDTIKFEDLAAREWLLPGADIILTNVLQTNTWIILNNQQSAYYRVKYDENLLNRIKLVLSSNHNEINVLNRAQLVDDSFNLARAGEITYSVAFGVLDYLKNETEYYPWTSAITGFNYLVRLFGETSQIGTEINKLTLDLLQNVYQTVPFSNLNESNHIYSLKLSMVLGRACKLGEASCITNVKQLFQAYKINGTGVDKNLKSCVYCNGLRYSDDIASDWNFLWEKFQQSSLSTEQVTIISTLGCTRNATYLRYYLEQSVNGSSGIRIQDLTSVWSAVYSSNSEGVDVALEYLMSNFQNIEAYYPGASSLLSGIGGYFSTAEQVARLEQLANSSSLHASLQSAVPSVIANARSSLEWVASVRGQFEEIFNIDPTNGTTLPSNTTAPANGTDPTASTPTTPSSGTSLVISSSLILFSIIITRCLNP